MRGHGGAAVPAFGVAPIAPFRPPARVAGAPRLLTARGALEAPGPGGDPQSRRRRSTLGDAAACAAAVAGVVLARPRAARAEATEGESKSAKQQRLLLGDPDVAEIRRVQQRLKLYDVKKKRFVPLTDLLRPGELLYEADVICIGELHDSLADHTVQRLIMDALTYQLFLDLRKEQGVDPTEMKGVVSQNASKNRITVGVEYFSRTQQEVLDDYIFRKKGSLDDFRKAVDWDNLWQFDWALYAPLFRFCKLNATKIIGMNLPFEVSLQVSRNGMDSLPDWLKEILPEVDLTKVKHRRRFEDMLKVPLEEAATRMDLPIGDFKPNPKLDTMYESQALWDDYMADTASRYVVGRGDGRLIVLAGVNHCWRDAIPDRIEAKSAKAGKKLRAVSVVPWRGSMEPSKLPTCADYIWCDNDDFPGGGQEAAQTMLEQRQRLVGTSRVFPAGYL